MSRIIDILLDLLFPGVCVGCRASLEGGGALCANCFSRIPYSGEVRCARCARRLPFGQPHCHKGEPTVVIAACDYADHRVAQLAQDLKFKNVKSAAKPLSDLMALAFLSSAFSEGSFTLVPVPLPPRRARQRGYNQAELLARHLSQKLTLPLRTDILRRTRENPPQTTLSDRKSRVANMAGAFIADASLGDPLPQKILLVDDVSTTGSTLREAARALKTAGAKVVVSLVAARA